MSSDFFLIVRCSVLAALVPILIPAIQFGAIYNLWEDTNYKVNRTEVVDVGRVPHWSFSNDTDELHLITCYPFTDWAEDGRDQRYVIQATLDRERR